MAVTMHLQFVDGYLIEQNIHEGDVIRRRPGQRGSSISSGLRSWTMLVVSFMPYRSPWRPLHGCGSNDSLRRLSREVADGTAPYWPLGFLHAALAQRGIGRPDILEEINRLLHWRAFKGMLSVIATAAKGEPSDPPLMMYKVLLLQRWYGLSDPAMEAALFDRVSFLRFAGLSLEDRTPDHSTIWRFRERLSRDGLVKQLFDELTRQLEDRGLIIKQGTLIDASMVTARSASAYSPVQYLISRAMIGTGIGHTAASLGDKRSLGCLAASPTVNAL